MLWMTRLGYKIYYDFWIPLWLMFVSHQNLNMYDNYYDYHSDYSVIYYCLHTAFYSTKLHDIIWLSSLHYRLVSYMYMCVTSVVQTRWKLRKGSRKHTAVLSYVSIAMIVKWWVLKVVTATMGCQCCNIILYSVHCTLYWHGINLLCCVCRCTGACSYINESWLVSHNHGVHKPQNGCVYTCVQTQHTNDVLLLLK